MRTHGPDRLPISSGPYLPLYTSSSPFILYAYLDNQKAIHVQERIPRLIRPRPGLLALLVLSVLLVNDRNGSGMSIHPSILLVVRMANLTTRKTTLNTLLVRYSI